MSHSISISWSASPAPISGYNVYRGTMHGNESTTALNSSPVIGTSYTDSAVFSGQTYSYLVKAVYNGVESLAGIDVTSTPVPFPGSPAALFDGYNVANSFVILGASTVTNVPGTATIVSGDVGVSPGSSITGFTSPAAISGVFHPGDFVAAAAQSAARSAFDAGMALVGATTADGDIGAHMLSPGLYAASSSLAITGVLGLDAHGDPNAVWVFQIGSTLTTATNNSYIVLLGGAKACNVYWLVGSSATLGTNTIFMGNILAQVSITANTNVFVDGRLIALTGAVTLDTDECILFGPDGLALPHSGPNVPPAPPAAPENLHIISEV